MQFRVKIKPPDSHFISLQSDSVTVQCAYIVLLYLGIFIALFMNGIKLTILCSAVD